MRAELGAREATMAGEQQLTVPLFELPGEDASFPEEGEVDVDEDEGGYGKSVGEQSFFTSPRPSLGTLAEIRLVATLCLPAAPPFREGIRRSASAATLDYSDVESNDGAERERFNLNLWWLFRVIYSPRRVTPAPKKNQKVEKKCVGRFLVFSCPPRKNLACFPHTRARGTCCRVGGRANKTRAPTRDASGTRWGGTSCRVVESAQVQRLKLPHEHPRFQALVSFGSFHPSLQQGGRDRELRLLPRGKAVQVDIRLTLG